MDEQKVAFSEVEVIARKIDLEQQYQAAQGMLSALGGAIQDCDWWLAKLAAKEEQRKAEQIAEAKAKEETAKKKKRKK